MNNSSSSIKSTLFMIQSHVKITIINNGLKEYMLKNIYYIVALIMLISTHEVMPAFAGDNSYDSAVILAYNYIDNPTESAKSITLEQFKNQLKELKRGKYNIIPLNELLTTLKDKHPLSNRTVSIIFNNYNENSIKKALPILSEYNIPFTVFYASNNVGENNFLEELSDNSLVSLGILPADNETLVEADDTKIAKNINKALEFHQNLIGERPSIFKYSQGEYSNKVLDIVKSYKFAGALTDNFGAISQKSNFDLIPTININREYGDLDLFISSLNTNYLNYTDVLPQDNLIKADKPLIGFTLIDDKIENDEDVSCFAGDIGKIKTIVIDKKRVEIRLNQPLIYRKTSINCTLLVRNKDPKENKWKSFSMTLIKEGELENDI